MPAIPELAALFEVPPGTMLLQRRLLTRHHGVPHQLVTTYCVLDTIDDNAMTRDNQEPWTAGLVP